MPLHLSAGIVERGTFDGLVRHGGLFARLVREGGFTVPEPAEDSALG